MHIYNEKTCKHFNEYFGCFHDGFIKKIEISSAKKFCQEMPWEPKKEFKNNEEQLRSTGLVYFTGTLLTLVINHYNYDWPNQPWNREIHLQIPHAENVSKHITKLIDIDIFELLATYKDEQITFSITYHEVIPEDRICSIENAEKIVICTAKKARITERKYA